MSSLCPDPRSFSVKQAGLRTTLINAFFNIRYINTRNKFVLGKEDSDLTGANDYPDRRGKDRVPGLACQVLGIPQIRGADRDGRDTSQPRGKRSSKVREFRVFSRWIHGEHPTGGISMNQADHKPSAPSHVQRHFKAHQRSCLRIKAYCERHSVSLSTFHYWRKRYQVKQTIPSNGKMRPELLDMGTLGLSHPACEVHFPVVPGI